MPLFMLPLLQRGCIWPFLLVHVCGKSWDHICWKTKGDRAVFCVKVRSPHIRLRHKHVSHSVLKCQFHPRVAALQQWKRTGRHRCSNAPCYYAFGRSVAKVSSPEVCVPVAVETQKETSGTSLEPVRFYSLSDDRDAGRGENRNLFPTPDKSYLITSVKKKTSNFKPKKIVIYNITGLTWP